MGNKLPLKDRTYRSEENERRTRAWVWNQACERAAVLWAGVWDGFDDPHPETISPDELHAIIDGSGTNQLVNYDTLGTGEVEGRADAGYLDPDDPGIPEAPYRCGMLPLKERKKYYRSKVSKGSKGSNRKSGHNYAPTANFDWPRRKQFDNEEQYRLAKLAYKLRQLLKGMEGS